MVLVVVVGVVVVVLLDDVLVPAVDGIVLPRVVEVLEEEVEFGEDLGSGWLVVLGRVDDAPLSDGRSQAASSAAIPMTTKRRRVIQVCLGSLNGAAFY